MSQSIIQDYEYFPSHISDCNKGSYFSDVFEIEDIEKIMKISNLTAANFITLLMQSYHTIKANKLYMCA